jgi:hypothetical protein
MMLSTVSMRPASVRRKRRRQSLQLPVRSRLMLNRINLLKNRQRSHLKRNLDKEKRARGAIMDIKVETGTEDSAEAIVLRRRLHRRNNDYGKR